MGGDGHAAVITMGEEGVVAVDPRGRVLRVLILAALVGLALWQGLH